MSISNEEKKALLVELDRRFDLIEGSIREIEREECIATLNGLKGEMQSEIAESTIDLCIERLWRREDELRRV